MGWGKGLGGRGVVGVVGGVGTTQCWYQYVGRALGDGVKESSVTKHNQPSHNRPESVLYFILTLPFKLVCTLWVAERKESMYEWRRDSARTLGGSWNSRGGGEEVQCRRETRDYHKELVRGRQLTTLTTTTSESFHILYLFCKYLFSFISSTGSSTLQCTIQTLPNKNRTTASTSIVNLIENIP